MAAPKPFTAKSAAQTAPFRNGGPVQYANFDQSYSPINSQSTQVAGAGAGYTVRQGDTLQTIAQAIWGDESLWYVLADANGLRQSGSYQPNAFVQAIPGAAAGVAGAAARSLITGTDFGDNLRAALPDVIASTLGNAIASKIQDNIVARANASNLSAQMPSPELVSGDGETLGFRTDTVSVDPKTVVDLSRWGLSASDLDDEAGLDAAMERKGVPQSARGTGWDAGMDYKPGVQIGQSGLAGRGVEGENVVDPVIITAPRTRLRQAVAEIEDAGRLFLLKSPPSWSAGGSGKALFDPSIEQSQNYYGQAFGLSAPRLNAQQLGQLRAQQTAVYRSGLATMQRDWFMNTLTAGAVGVPALAFAGYAAVTGGGALLSRAALSTPQAAAAGEGIQATFVRFVTSDSGAVPLSRIFTTSVKSGAAWGAGIELLSQLSDDEKREDWIKAAKTTFMDRDPYSAKFMVAEHSRDVLYAAVAGAAGGKASGVLEKALWATRVRPFAGITAETIGGAASGALGAFLKDENILIGTVYGAGTGFGAKGLNIVGLKFMTPKGTPHIPGDPTQIGEGAGGHFKGLIQGSAASGQHAFEYSSERFKSENDIK